MIVRNLDSQEDLIVVSVTEDANGTTYQVLDEDTWTPYILEASKVDVIDNRRPDRWVVKKDSDAKIETFPEFMKPGFWEDFFDENSDAIIAYRSVYPKSDDISILLEDIKRHGSIGWSEISVLLAKEWAKPRLAIEFATSRVPDSSDDDEIELAGLSETDRDEIDTLVARLVEVLPKANLDDTKTLALSWCQRSYPDADIEAFGKRVDRCLTS